MQLDGVDKITCYTSIEKQPIYLIPTTSNVNLTNAHKKKPKTETLTWKHLIFQT